MPRKRKETLTVTETDASVTSTTYNWWMIMEGESPVMVLYHRKEDGESNAAPNQTVVPVTVTIG